MNEAAALEHKRSEVASIDRKIRKLVDAITSGADALSLNQELVSLERRKQDLERELASETSPKPLIHPNLAEVYRRKVADLHQALYDKDSAPEAFEPFAHS